jgi:hypothetical protein
MRRTWFLLLVLFASPAAAEPVKLFDGVLSFELPPGFRPLSEAEIAQVPQSLQLSMGAQLSGYTDGDSFDVTVLAARATHPAFEASMLSTIGGMMQQLAAQRDGVTMRRHGPVSIGGAQWYAIDFGSQTPEESVEVLIRMGVRRGYLVVVSAKALTRAFPQREAELLRVLETLKLD